jgi:cyanophycin synthetase
LKPSMPATGAMFASRAIDTLSLYYKGRQRGRGRKRGAGFVGQQRSAFYQTVWREAATGVGATVVDLDGSMMEIYHGSLKLLVCDNMTSLDDPVTLAAAGNKPLVYRLLTERQLPVPAHFVCRYDDLAAARKALAALGGLCVAKPALGGAGGRGVTTAVSGGPSLVRALAYAGAWSPEVVLERPVEGHVYRLLYLDGELLDAVRRGPPLLRGDGHSAIRQLVAAENADRAARGVEVAQSLIGVDADLRHTLSLQGYHLGSVPAAGVVVRAKTVVNDNRRDENEAATDSLCGGVVEAGAAAAAALGVRLAGVDVITRDPGIPLPESGGAVLEVNTTPGYYYHYMRKGGGTPVAAMILERLVAGAR